MSIAKRGNNYEICNKFLKNDCSRFTAFMKESKTGTFLVYNNIK